MSIFLKEQVRGCRCSTPARGLVGTSGVTISCQRPGRDTPRSCSRRGFISRAATFATAGLAASTAPRALSAENTDAAKALGLKITGLKTFLVDTGPDRDENYVFVKIYTNKGLVGLGEGTMTGKCKTVATAIEEHERYLVGKDPTDIEYLWQAMFRGPRYRGGPILISALGVSTSRSGTSSARRSACRSGNFSTAARATK